MGGHPNWFQVTNLEVLNTGDPSGSEMKDVITVETGAPVGDAFDLLVTFEGDKGTWWGIAEWVSDPGQLNFPLNATATFFIESMGPGPEREIGTNTVRLQVGGNPGGGSGNTSIYQIRLGVPNADTAFRWWVGGQPQQGVFQFTCRVDFTIGPFFASAYYEEDLVVLVREGQSV